MWKTTSRGICFATPDGGLYSIPVVYFQSAVAGGHGTNVGTQVFGVGSDWPTNATSIQEMKKLVTQPRRKLNSANGNKQRCV